MVSNMDTTGTIEMALEMQKHQIITCLHKYYTADDLVNKGLDPEYFAVSTGIGEKDLDKFNKIMDVIDPKIICIDVAKWLYD